MNFHFNISFPLLCSVAVQQLCLCMRSSPGAFLPDAHHQCSTALASLWHQRSGLHLQSFHLHLHQLAPAEPLLPQDATKKRYLLNTGPSEVKTHVRYFSPFCSFFFFFLNGSRGKNRHCMPPDRTQWEECNMTADICTKMYNTGITVKKSRTTANSERFYKRTDLCSPKISRSEKLRKAWRKAAGWRPARRDNWEQRVLLAWPFLPTLSRQPQKPEWRLWSRSVWNSLFYSCNFSASLKWFQDKKLSKWYQNNCLYTQEVDSVYNWLVLLPWTRY